MKVATKKKEKNHARCSKMCRPLPPTKILYCPQCIKAKINSSIKGRSYLKHLNCFFFFFEISFTLANVSSQKKNNNKTKKQKQKAKRKEKKKQKEKKIKTNMVQLHKALSKFMWHPNRQESPVT